MPYWPGLAALWNCVLSSSWEVLPPAFTNLLYTSNSFLFPAIIPELRWRNLFCGRKGSKAGLASSWSARIREFCHRVLLYDDRWCIERFDGFSEYQSNLNIFGTDDFYFWRDWKSLKLSRKIVPFERCGIGKLYRHLWRRRMRLTISWPCLLKFPRISIKKDTYNTCLTISWSFLFIFMYTCICIYLCIII